MTKNQNIKNALYEALDIIGLINLAKFYQNWATLWLAVCVPVEKWGPIFLDFPIHFAENACVVALFHRIIS